jgi:hypothetical protein
MAQFLDRVGPDGDPTYFADQIAKLAQTLQDLNESVRAPMLYPALQSAAIQRWSGLHEPISHSQ